MQIRPIEAADNKALASIIREVLTEFGANKPGFAWQDPELDAMAQSYQASGRSYWVVEHEGQVLGGGGIAEFPCPEQGVCELQKMYLLPAARGRGQGLILMQQLLNDACNMGYQSCYLETLLSMAAANKLYQRVGFKALSAPMGNSGHNACDQWYVLNLYREDKTRAAIV